MTALAASLELEPERLGDALRGSRARPRPGRAASSPTSVVPSRPEHDVRVGVGRLRAAAPVARRAGVGARRLRPVAQRAGRVDPGERAAAGADRQHLDGREADRVAVLDVPLLRRCATRRRRRARCRSLVPPMSRPIAFSKPHEPATWRRGDGAGRDAGGGEPHGEPLDAVRGVITPPPECSSSRSPS